MLNKPKDAVGKWFSNLLGIPTDYFFILGAEGKSNYKYIIVPNRGRWIDEPAVRPFSLEKDLREPIKDLITLTRLRHKAIRGILK